MMHFKWQQVPSKVRIFTDADWAGCKESRKSTSGGCICVGSHCLKTWSKTQSLIALSSGESEFYAALKASAEGLGIMSLMRDFGWETKGEVMGDASAALGIINRKGLGRTRHLDTGLLWIQQTAAEKRLKYTKVLGTDNPADLLTKYLPLETLDRHCQKLDITFPTGRAAAAPQLNTLQFTTRATWELDAPTEENNEDKDFKEMIGNLQMMINEKWNKGWKFEMRKYFQSLSAISDEKISYEEDDLGLLQPKTKKVDGATGAG